MYETYPHTHRPFGLRAMIGGSTPDQRLAVLSERVDHLITRDGALQQSLGSIDGKLQQMTTILAVIEQKQSTSDGHDARVFSILDAHTKRLDDLTGEVKVHAWTWKLVGAMAVLSLGTIGWTVNKLEELPKFDRRLTIVEFITGGRTVPQPPTSEMK